MDRSDGGRGPESDTVQSDAAVEGRRCNHGTDETVVSALETEEKDLRERLVVLEEQKFMVQAMITSATGARRFEEVSALTRNVDELDKEIENIRVKVSGVEERWQGLYASGGPGPA